MAATNFGAKNQPIFKDLDAPDAAVNPTQSADYAAKVGNRRVGTTSERNLATGKDVWEGLLWGDTTNGGEYKRIGGAWVLQTVVKGVVGVAITASTLGTVAITFPPGLFTKVPVVTASLNGAVSGSQKLTARAYNITKDGAMIACYTGDGTTATITAPNNPVGWSAGEPI